MPIRAKGSLPTSALRPGLNATAHAWGLVLSRESEKVQEKKSNQNLKKFNLQIKGKEQEEGRQAGRRGGAGRTQGRTRTPGWAAGRGDPGPSLLLGLGRLEPEVPGARGADSQVAPISPPCRDGTRTLVSTLL